jgi:hypothetical protein
MLFRATVLLSQILCCLLAWVPATALSASGILFEEAFEDTKFTTRGWYDGALVPVTTNEHIPGSTASAAFHWLPGAAGPVGTYTMRRKFGPSDSVYVSYWVKYSANYVGSGKPYHPHEFYVLTNLDGDYSGLSYTKLTAYIEQNAGTPRLTIQDGRNIDESHIGVNLVGVTENRSVAGCNGDSDGYGNGDCYLAGSSHQNGKMWIAGRPYFTNTIGPNYKNDWHFVEAYFKLNSVVNGVGARDGVIQYWFDGGAVINIQNAVLRTGRDQTMQFNQFVIAPYIGDGSPIDQTFWVDNLLVGTARPQTVPTAPTNLQVRQP